MSWPSLSLRAPGLRGRHWEQLSEEIGVTINPDEHAITLTEVLDMNLDEHLELMVYLEAVLEYYYSLL